MQAVICAHRGRGRGSEGLEFPEPLSVPGHFGKLACLAFLSSEAALVGYTNTESSAFTRNCLIRVACLHHCPGSSGVRADGCRPPRRGVLGSPFGEGRGRTQQ